MIIFAVLEFGVIVFLLLACTGFHRQKNIPTAQVATAKTQQKPEEKLEADLQKLPCMQMHFLEPVAISHFDNGSPHTAIAYRCRICLNMYFSVNAGTFSLEQLNTPSQAEMDRVAKRMVEHG